MEPRVTARILWAAADADPGSFPEGEYRVEIVRGVHSAFSAVERAGSDGSPFAACFLRWGEEGFGSRDVDDLLRASPELFLVLEGLQDGGGQASSLGSWVAQDRCLALRRPVEPWLRGSIACHLVARWSAEAAGRSRAALLESQARGNREEPLQVLYGIVEKLHGAKSVEDSLPVILGEMSRFLGATSGSLLLLERDSTLRVVEAVGPSREVILGLSVPLEESRIARHALEGGEPILLEDIQENDRFGESEESVRYRPRSILSVPLFARGEPLGVLNFGGGARKSAFTRQDRRLVLTLSRQVAVAIEKSKLLEGLKQTVAQSIRALAGAIEAKDPYTRGHSDRVTHYARLTAHAMGFRSADLDVLVRAAILHDVGKIGVPERVLNKPSPLDEDELALIQRHPEIGVEIVSEMAEMRQTLPIIRAHHERYDGLGYPDGTAGQEIPLGARILAVADTYDAMTSDRPYRKGLPIARALREIQRCSGSQFDPEVARIFIRGVPCWPDTQTEPAQALVTGSRLSTRAPHSPSATSRSVENPSLS